jgi:hypothetical protein
LNYGISLSGLRWHWWDFELAGGGKSFFSFTEAKKWWIICVKGAAKQTKK